MCACGYLDMAEPLYCSIIQDAYKSEHLATSIYAKKTGGKYVWPADSEFKVLLVDAERK